MRVRILAPALVTATLISACGGGGGDATTVTPVTPVAPAATTSLIGVAAKGPLKSALVQAFKVNDAGTVGDKITEKETDANGGYTLELGTYAGAVQLVVNVIPGKTKSRDEATGLDQTLPDDFKLRANMVVTAAGSSNQIQNASITPFTELANKIAEDSGGLSKANIAAASKLVFDLIGVDPVATQPLDSTVAPAGGATVESSGCVATGSMPIRSNTTLLAAAMLALLRPPESKAILWASSVNGVIDAFWIWLLLPAAATTMLARSLKSSGSVWYRSVASSLDSVLPGITLTTSCTVPE